MLVFTSVVVIVFGVLQIILFFKLWGMTNDVASMQAMMKKALKNIQKVGPNEDVVLEPQENGGTAWIHGLVWGLLSVPALILVLGFINTVF